MLSHAKTYSLYFSERVNEAIGSVFLYPLTVVEAPMGYGKSTAVREHLRRVHAKALWLKVYSGSVTDFWTGLCDLLGEVDLELSRNLAHLGFPNDRVSLHEALRLLECMNMQEPLVLCIDDYHLLNETAAESFIEYLALNELNHLHIVLIARYIRLVSLEELLLKGYLFRITKETFELTPEDIVKYYRLCSIDLQPADADKLYTVTEGWISALYLIMLNYREQGSFTTTQDIYKLVENVIYRPFSDEIKDFVLKMSICDHYTIEQARYIGENENAEALLVEIVNKNAFITYDARNRTYHMHHIFTNFLQEIMARKGKDFRDDLYRKAGEWHEKTGEFLAAMRCYHAAGDFGRLLSAVEHDNGNSFGNTHKELLLRYFEECPEEIRRQHISALFIFVTALIPFNEMALFRETCGEISERIRLGGFEPETAESLTGELELLISFSSYNDVTIMMEHMKKASGLMRKPSIYIMKKAMWSFGSPSALYLFYRERGKLEPEVQEIKEIFSLYQQLTNGHGTGAEAVMEAEWLFHQGACEDAEIAAHRALLLGRVGAQPNTVVCACFLLARMALLKGDYDLVLDMQKKMQEEIERSKAYMLIHTIDMCRGFVSACLQQAGSIPWWLADGDFNSNRLSFPTVAFSNIIYGRALLLKGKYLMLLGSAEHFMDVASIFNSLLAKIYTLIYVAAANEKLYRRGEAVDAAMQALAIAIPDKVYMPFVENCDYIQPILEDISAQHFHRADIARILQLYKPYQKSLDGIKAEYFTANRPELSKREAEISQLAAEGYSNKAIGDRLYISENTVKTQLKSIFKKTGIKSRALLKRYFEDNRSLMKR